MPDMEQPAEDREFNAKLAAAARDEHALWTRDCPEPDVLIDLIEKGADSPDARRKLAHIVGCAYCRREFEEMERTLKMAAKAQAMQTAVPTPASPVRSSEQPSVWHRWSASSLSIALAAAALLFVYVSIIRPQQRELADLRTRQYDLIRQNYTDNRWLSLLRWDHDRLTQENERLRLENRKPPAHPTQVALNDDALVQKAVKNGLKVALVPGSDSTPVRSGPGQEAPDVTPLSPVGTFVQEARPTFRWKPLARATGYTVFIVYAGGDRKVVDQRESLSGTAWTPARPLPRGKDLEWQVKALRGGKEVGRSPSAKFHVLDPKQVELLLRAKDSLSLTLGVLHARAGLLDDAEREFRSIPKTDPGYPAAQKLLRDLLAKRQHPKTN